MTECHTLIISDIHLGSRVCRAERVLEVLREVKFKDLIINGDLFDSDTTYKFNGKHWEVVSAIADIADRHYVVLVGGNHGRELDTLARRIGLRVIDNHAFTVGKRNFLCLHGDEFDIFIKYLPMTSKLFAWLYIFIQRFGGKKQRVSIFIKRLSKIILGLDRSQKRLALRKGAKQHANVVICSHTHIPHVDTRNDILFVNSGSFCDNPCNYVTIDKSGLVELREV
ncbi:MAG: metallophosphoesterase family protein [Minisyncoccia bacterium]|jgi:predicted phosphodiesterase